MGTIFLVTLVSKSHIVLSLAICWEQQTDPAYYMIDLIVFIQVIVSFIQVNGHFFCTLTPISEFSGDQHETNMQLLHPLKIGGIRRKNLHIKVLV